MASLAVLDYWTQVSLDSIWREQVAKCIEASRSGQTIDNETSTTDGKIMIDNKTFVRLLRTIISEPVCGYDVNRI